MKKIVFLINFLPNPRIKRRITLAKKYGEVALICWDRGNSMQELPNIPDIRTYVIKEESSSHPIKRVIPFLHVKKKAYEILVEEKPDIIHIQGLDMLGVACRYKSKQPNVKIIYEVADLHKLIVDKQKKVINKCIQLFIKNEERNLCKNIDLLIVTSEQYYTQHFINFIPKTNYMYIPNIPDLSAFDLYEKKESKEFVIGFLGVIRYKEQVKMLLDASKRTKTKVLIAGYEQNGNEIENISKSMDNVTWVGRFNFEEKAAELYGNCDAIFSVYDADMQNVRVALPNKLYESVYCELPIIVAKGTYLAEVVDEWGVGIAVDHKSVDELVMAINQLKIKKGAISENCKKRKSDLIPQKYNIMLKEHYL